MNYWRHNVRSCNRRLYLIKNCFVRGFYYRKMLGTNYEEKADNNNH